MNSRDSSMFAQTARRIDLFVRDRPVRSRELPIDIDSDLQVLMSFDNVVFPWNEDSCLECIECSEMQRLLSNFSNIDELQDAMQVPLRNIEKMCMDAISCVGCRRSFENAVDDMKRYNYSTLDPLIIIGDEYVTLDEKILRKPGKMARFFRGGSITRLDILFGCNKKTKRNQQRCILHSIDIKQNHTLLPVWKTAWDEMNDICKEHVTKVDTEVVHAKLVEHLKRHRFCVECRNKMFRAFSMVVGGNFCVSKKNQTDSTDEVCSHSELEACSDGCTDSDSDSDSSDSDNTDIVMDKEEQTTYHERQLRITPKTEYVAKLISKAEPELNSKYKNCYNKREKHAKTIEIAQEEILACVGMCIYDRLYKVFLRSREEENNYRIFAFAAVDLLYRQLEMEAQKKKQGKTNIEIYCEELEQKEQLKRSAERKKLKKRKQLKKKKLNEAANKAAARTEAANKPIERTGPVNNHSESICNHTSSFKVIDSNHLGEITRIKAANKPIVHDEFEIPMASGYDNFVLENDSYSFYGGDNDEDEDDMDEILNAISNLESGNVVSFDEGVAGLTVDLVDETSHLRFLTLNDGGSDISSENAAKSDPGYFSEHLVGTEPGSTANSQFEDEVSPDLQLDNETLESKISSKIRKLIDDGAIPEEVDQFFEEHREVIDELRRIERTKLVKNFYRYLVHSRQGVYGVIN